MDMFLDFFANRLSVFFKDYVPFEIITMLILAVLVVGFVAQLILIWDSSWAKLRLSCRCASIFFGKVKFVNYSNKHRFYKSVVRQLDRNARDGWFDYCLTQNDRTKALFLEKIKQMARRRMGLAMFNAFATISFAALGVATVFSNMQAGFKTILVMAVCFAAFALYFILRLIKLVASYKIENCALKLCELIDQNCNLLDDQNVVIKEVLSQTAVETYEKSGVVDVVPQKPFNSCIDTIEDTVYGIIKENYSKGTYLSVLDSVKGALSHNYLAAEDKSKLENLAGLLEIRLGQFKMCGNKN